jgi:hypothetical protein
MALETIFKPKKKYKLIRIGNFNDGGYLVGENSLKKTETLLSFGIDDNWQFEKYFKINNINTKILCYDNKPILKYLIKKFIIEFIFFPYHRRLKFIKYFNNIIEFLIIKKKIVFFQKKIFYNDLNQILKKIKNDNIFLKIDIEGSEYRILEEIIKNQKRIIGIVIEFHDFDYHKNIIYDFCKRLKLNLIHIHPNNFAPKDKNGDPTVIELTFEKESMIDDGDKNNNCVLPHKLDMKNNPFDRDIDLVFKKDKSKNDKVKVK